MYPLDSVSVSGFKSIHHLNGFRLRALNVLIGANGAGKSNFISLFKLLHEIINGSLQTYVGIAGGAETQLYFGRKVTGEIRIRLEFKRNGYEITLAPSASDSLIISNEICWYDYPDGRHYPVQLGRGVEESKLSGQARAGNISKHVFNSIKDWKVYHFHDTSESAKVKLTGDIDDNEMLRPDASNLAAFLFLLKEKYPGYYTRIINTVRLAAPFFDDFVLRPSPRNPDKIRLEWRERGSDDYFNASHLSDGTLRFICLSTLLLQPNLPSTLLIDEPELGLHPFAISLLSEMLESVASSTQVIVSTQSIALVNHLDPEDIIVVDREDDQSVLKRLSSQDLTIWLDEYSLGELWEMNVLGGRP